MKWPTLDPGELRHQITILRPVSTSDESGASVEMQAFVTAYAKIEAVRGIDVIRSGQTTTQLYLTVTMWWQAGIAANQVVKTLNGHYEIQSAENLLEMNTVLKLNCVALAANSY